MVQDNNIQNNQEEESEIDLVEMAQKLWAGKKTIIKGCIIGAVLGLVVALSIPKEYTTTIKLSPEISDSKGKMGGGLSTLASMAGVNLSQGNSVDAVYPNLYPDVVSSVPFIVNLFDVQVTTSDGKTMAVADYMKNETHGAWWSAILSFPGKAIGWFISLFKDKEEGEGTINPYHLTTDQWQMVEGLRKRISADVDTKTSVITIGSTMQDPVVSAQLADTVAENLKRHITQYRIQKAVNDVEYAQKINNSARKDYYEAQQRYADYVDKNHNVALNSRRTEEERLSNEASLAFNLYNTTAAQLQQLKAKVQENTPVYAVIQPATVPHKANSSRLMKLVAFTFLGFVVTAAWVIFGALVKDTVDRIKGDTPEAKINIKD